MNGILVVNKPQGITSHDVINIVRRVYQTKKVGHVGTLDPIASGVLVVLVNQATKLAPFLESDDKIYECEVLVGTATDTYDTTGVIVENKEDFYITNEMIDNVMLKFIGEINQYPPIYSAIKVKGKKLYQYARSKEEVVIEPRQVKIFDLTRTTDLYERDGKVYFKFITHVSKGTYIRSLVYDMGQELKIPCCMSNLIRVKSGRFDLEKSFDIEDIKVGKSCLVKMIDSITIPTIDISDNQEILNKIKNGMKISLNAFNEKYNQIAFVLGDELLAIYEFNNEMFPCYKASRVWL